MQAQHAHALRPQTASPSISVSKQKAPDEQFLELLSKLVGRAGVSGAESDIEIKAAELPEEKVQHEPAPEEEEIREFSVKEENKSEVHEQKKEKSEEEKPVEATLQTQSAPNEEVVEEGGAVQTKAPVEKSVAEKSQSIERLQELVEQVANGKDVAAPQKLAQAAEKQTAQRAASEQILPVNPAPIEQQKLSAEKPLAAQIEVIRTAEEENPLFQENLLLPANPELNRIPAPKVSAQDISAKAEGMKVAAALPPRAEVPVQLSLSRASVLDKALEALSKSDQPVASLSLLNERSKSALGAKELQRGNALTAKQEKIIVQIQRLLDQAAKMKDGTTLTVKIQPDELGQVTVRVTQRGDQLFARVIPESKEVEHTVRTGVEELVAKLVSAGFKAENIHISVGKEWSESALLETKSNGLGAFLGERKGSAEEGAQKEARHGSRNNLQSGSEGPPPEQSGESKVADGSWVA